MRRVITLSALTLSALLTGCVTTQGEHTYVNGNCVDCWQNPFGKREQPQGAVRDSQMVGQPQSASSQGGFVTVQNPTATPSTGHPCGERENNFGKIVPRTDHGDPRWCEDMTLPNGQWGAPVYLSKVMPYDVDVAYIKIKNQFDFLDPDDIAKRKALGQKYIANTGIDTEYEAIPGKLYYVVGNYGGPVRKVDYLARYELEVLRVGPNESEVNLKYSMYDAYGRNPAQWGEMMLGKVL